MASATPAPTAAAVVGRVADRRDGRPAARLVRPARRRRPRMLDEPFDGDRLAGLRAAVAAHAEALGVGSAVDDIVLAAHELCSNAVKHGGGSGRLRLWREDGRILCRVSDLGPGVTDPARRGMEPPTPYATGGRGLWIARSLADVDIVTGPHGTTVTAAIRAT